MLVVLEQDIVPRPVQFNQVALEDERLQLAVHQHDVEVVHLFDHRAHLGRVVSAVVKVLADPVFEVLGLADVDDFPVGLHQVAAGRIGQRAQLERKLPGHGFTSLRSRSACSCVGAVSA